MSAGLASGLDHVGIVVRDRAAALAEWAALGFAAIGGRIMLGRGYLEVLADDPARPSATLARFLARGEGAHVLSLRVASAVAAQERLARAGFAVELLASARPADPDRPAGDEARFLRLPLTDADPRLQLIEHQTPELVWQPRWLAQPNGAAGLASVAFTAAEPMALAARLSRVAGRPVTPSGEGLRLALPAGAIDITQGDGPPRIARITLSGPELRTVRVNGVELCFVPG